MYVYMYICKPHQVRIARLHPRLLAKRAPSVAPQRVPPVSICIRLYIYIRVYTLIVPRRERVARSPP